MWQQAGNPHCGAMSPDVFFAARISTVVEGMNLSVVCASLGLNLNLGERCSCSSEHSLHGSWWVPDNHSCYVGVEVYEAAGTHALRSLNSQLDLGLKSGLMYDRRSLWAKLNFCVFVLFNYLGFTPCSICMACRLCFHNCMLK